MRTHSPRSGRRTTRWRRPITRGSRLDLYYLDPAEETAALEAAGFVVTTTTIRRPIEEAEAQTRRCYVLAQRT